MATGVLRLTKNGASSMVFRTAACILQRIPRRGQLNDVVLVVSVLIENDLIAVLIDPAVFSVISVDLYIVKPLDYAPIALERVQRDILLKPAVKLNVTVKRDAQGLSRS